MRSFNGLDSDSSSSSSKKNEELGVWYDVLSRYDSLMGSSADADANDDGKNQHSNKSTQTTNSLEQMAIELWKYCLLYNGDGHIYLDYESSLLSPLHDLVTLDSNVGIIADNQNDKHRENSLHSGFIAISSQEPATYELGAMIRLLLETSDEVLIQNPSLISRELHIMIVGRADQTLNSKEERNDEKEDEEESLATWTLLRNRCWEMDNEEEGADLVMNSNVVGTFDVSRRIEACPLSSGGYCCLAFSEEVPIMAFRHPVAGWGGSSSSMELPYLLNINKKKEGDIKLGGVPEGDLPYISTVRMDRNDTTSEANHDSTIADTPNFFDILFENDCLPYRKECHRCLKDVANEAPMTDDEGKEIAVTTTNACSVCQLECPCYCDILCKVRPPPKKVVRTYVVHPPRYKKEVGRLVPKIIHQVCSLGVAVAFAISSYLLISTLFCACTYFHLDVV